MQPAKLDIFFAFMAYGGNGGIAMLLPEVMTWFSKLCLDMRDDPRIGRFAHKRFGDVPLTMERNRAVLTAKQGKFDVLVMIDSDNAPDLLDGIDPAAKPFFSSSFDFLYERKQRGLPSAICAPYCGPPPHPTKGGMENPYVFFAENYETGHAEAGFTFEAYSRQQAALMQGIQPIAAGPTGVIMYSVDAFDLMPVNNATMSEVLNLYKSGVISEQRACQLLSMESWFFYEYTDLQQTQKASTEDVTNTREIQLAGCDKFGEPVVFCNWDAWAGHYKPKCVGKPQQIHMTQVNALYREAIENNHKFTPQLVEVDFTKSPSDDVEDFEEEDDVPAQEENVEFSKEVPTLREIQVSTRMIGSRKVTSVQHFTPDLHLEGLAAIVKMVVKTRKKKPLRIVEVGSWVGESAIAMHEALGPAGGTIWCVDTWEGSKTDRTSVFMNLIGQEEVFKYFLKNVGDLLDNGIRCIKGESVTIASQFPKPQEADLIFIDASHDYESCRADLVAWFPHVADNGIICGHDFCDLFPGVIRAVKELCDEGGIMPNIMEDTSVWCFSKADWLKGVKAREAKSGVQSTRSKDASQEAQAEADTVRSEASPAEVS